MHPDLQRVIELQEVDQRIASLGEQMARIPSQIKTLEDQLGQFQRAQEEGKQRLAANQKERRDLDSEIQEIRAKISKHKDQLYQVKTNEQYRAMLHEIEGEETKIRGLEDAILDKMDEAENLEKRIQEARARLDSESRRVASEKERLDTDRATAQRELDQAQERRQEVAGALSDAVLRLYEKTRKARGVAVVPMVNGSCAGCHFLLRPQAFNEVRTAESIMTCENCSRILYYVESPVDQTVEGTRVAL